MEAPSFHLTATDRATLAISDEEFVPDTWQAVRNAIEAKDLSTLPRKPSTLRKYIVWAQHTIAEYGSIANFVRQERLQWEDRDHISYPVKESLIKGTPFANPSRYKILYNDWPYGLTDDIQHLVVWMKTRLETDELSEELKPDSQSLIQRFVDTTFTQRMKKDGLTEDCVMWFKNAPKLQSVGALEHFHVIVRGASMDMLEEWTGGDIPMYRRSSLTSG